MALHQPAALTEAGVLSQALPLIFHHSSISQDPQRVCALLCVSKLIRAAVAQHCAGKVRLCSTADTLPIAQQFATWLAKHARLLRFLGLELPAPGEADSARQLAEDAVVDALKQAAAAAEPHQLLLQSFHTFTPSAGVLQQLANSCGSNLTELHCYELDSATQVQGVAAAVATLTGLRCLTLSVMAKVDEVEDPYGIMSGINQHVQHDNTLLPSLSGLTQLEKLQLNEVDEMQWDLLPQQLQHLTLLNFGGGSIRAGHLTALATLDIISDALAPAYAEGDIEPECGFAASTVFPSYYLTEGDVLPPGLARVEVADCDTLDPLLQLQQLRSLRLSNSQLPTEELLGLSSLSGLSSLELGYAEVDAAADAAAAWGKLPLRCLHVNTDYVDFELKSGADFDDYLDTTECYAAKLPTSTIQWMAKACGLTELCIKDCFAPAEEVAAALQQLTSLQRLQLCRMIWHAERNSDGDDSSGSDSDDSSNENRDDRDSGLPEEPGMDCRIKGWECVLQAVTDLPVLSSLQLSQQRLGAAAAQLAAATQLTHLSLNHSSVEDAAVVVMVSSLTDLQELDLHYNPGITDAVLPGIVQHLQQLTALDVRDTNITREGRQQLSSMAQLVQLRAGRFMLADPDAPKRPKDAFARFMEEYFPRIQQEHSYCSCYEVEQQVHIMWQQLAAEDKERYQEEGKKDEERYKQEMETYESKW